MLVNPDVALPESLCSVVGTDRYFSGWPSSQGSESGLCSELQGTCAVTNAALRPLRQTCQLIQGSVQMFAVH